MVMVKTNENAVSTIPVGPLGDIRTTNMMVNGKRMAEKFSVFPTFHKYGYLVSGSDAQRQCQFSIRIVDIFQNFKIEHRN